MNDHRDILFIHTIWSFMRREKTTNSGLRLVVTAICVILLVLPGIALAENVTNTTPTEVTPAGTTVIPTTIPLSETVTVTPYPNPPPYLVLGVPVIENFTCTMYGVAAPGSENVTIENLQWDWGDNQTSEYHDFPNSHTYSSPGEYTIIITAIQSDGQDATKTATIFVEPPVTPPVTTSPTVNLTTPVTTMTPAASASPTEPAIPVSPPVLTLLEPVVDGMNVTLNGNLNPGSPGTVITQVSVDWDDGNVTTSPDLPVTYHYATPGTYTIAITGTQSDGLSTTKRITLDIKQAIPVSPGQTPGSPPPDNQSIFLVILVTAIAVVVIGAIVQQVVSRRRGPVPVPGNHGFTPKSGPMPKTLPSREELEKVCSGTDVTPEVLDSVIRVAVEIAREGREGQAIGTSFVVGDTENVLDHSRQFVLNPFHGHNEAERQITDVSIRGHIKEFAQLDGAFIVTGAGVVEAAGRYITVDVSQVNLPGGLGSRHSSVAGITMVTRSIGVVVSQSGGLITIFRDGKIVYTMKW
jgi:DNA integrity scanning protein DisA with diadenylate cyclase activity/PKD repeat protein